MSQGSNITRTLGTSYTTTINQQIQHFKHRTTGKGVTRDFCEGGRVGEREFIFKENAC